MGISSSVSLSGPFFDDRAEHAVTEFLADATEHVAHQEFAEWRTNLDHSIRHPTPYYEVQTNVHRVSAERYEVNDRDVIYGPWLEGVGSRNSPHTRFPGYFSMRKAVQTMEGKIPDIIETELDKHIEEMN